ncbi:MAG: hypothetical protein NC419_12855 [Muribaculaceae bacterium]|nr:hypothetical protein [Muribaculaceae bacterium]
MKKKTLALLLAISCVVSMTACAGTGNSDEAGKQEEISKEEQDLEKAQESMPEEDIVPEPEASFGPDETTQETEDTDNTEQTNETDSSKTSNMPSELSDNLYDFQISIDGTVYQFPLWFSDFEAAGWKFDGDDITTTLASNEYIHGQRWKKDGASVYTTIANLSMNTVTLDQGIVSGIKFDDYDLKDCDWEILLPGGIARGVSNADDVRAAYGEPTYDHDMDTLYAMTYRYDNYSEIKLYINKETNALSLIELNNLVELEGADNSIKEDIPDVVKNYKAPTSLGSDLYSFNVEIEDNLYTLPCPVSEFLANGFRINESRTDETVAAGNTGWVELMYNNQSMHVLTRNYGDYATIIENCFVLDVESSDNGSAFAMTFPGNIQRGSTDADVRKAIQDFNFEEETSDLGYTYYTIYDPNGSKLDAYSICTKDGVVIKMSISTSKKTLQ